MDNINLTHTITQQSTYIKQLTSKNDELQHELAAVIQERDDLMAINLVNEHHIRSLENQIKELTRNG